MNERLEAKDCDTCQTLLFKVVQPRPYAVAATTMDIKDLAKRIIETKSSSECFQALIQYRRSLRDDNAFDSEQIFISFVPQLISHAVSTPFGSNAIRLVAMIALNTVELYSTATTAIEKKLRSLAKAACASPQPPRQILSLAKLSREIHRVRRRTSRTFSNGSSSLLDSAFGLMLAAGYALEKMSAYSKRQRRIKRLSLAQYAVYSRWTATDHPQEVGSLLMAIERVATTPSLSIRADALVAIVILSTYASREGEEQRNFLLQYVEACANVALRGGLEMSKDVVRCACSALYGCGVFRKPRPTFATDEELVNTLMAIAQKALLRQKETALEALPVFLGAFKELDLSSGVDKVLLPTTVDALKSSNERARESGLMLTRLLVRGVEDSNAICDVTRLLAASLGSAKFFYQRIGLSKALEALAAFEGLLLDEEVVTILLHWLCEKKESNEEARKAGINTLMIWACRPQSSGLSSESLTQIMSLIQGKYMKDNDTRIALCSVSQIAEQNGLSSGVWLRDVFIGPFAEYLCAVLKKEKVKQDTKIHAANILLTLRTYDIKAKSLYESEVNSLLLSESETPLTITKLQEARDDTLLAGVSALKKLYIYKKNWIVLGAKHSLCQMLLKCTTDKRLAVAQRAQDAVKAIRTTLHGLTDGNFLEAFWLSELESFKTEGTSVGAHPLQSDPDSPKRLRKSLCGLILPPPSLENVGIALLAAHHPRLSHTRHAFSKIEGSRYWEMIKSGLPKLSDDPFNERADDWLTDAVDFVFDEKGLRSRSSTEVHGAVCAIASLAREYPERVVKMTLPLLRPLAYSAVGISKEHIEMSERLVQVGDTERSRNLSSGLSNDPALPPKPKSVGRKTSQGKHGKSETSARDRQQRQAERDRAKTAAAMWAASEKKAAEEHRSALEVSRQLGETRSALLVIRCFAWVAKGTVYKRTPALLSLTLPTASIEPLKILCVSTLVALAAAAPPPLTKFADAIALALYCLESKCANAASRLSLIENLHASVPPPLPAESFALVAPLIKAAMTGEPESEDRDSRGRQSSSRRKKPGLLAKTASQILVEQTKPDALDSALAAASARAGSWAIAAMEREDVAFGPASEALANLASTALNPDSEELSQVLEGLLSSTSSVREGALLALERIPALSIPNVQCPRDPILGRSLALAVHDPEVENAQIAKELWQCYGHGLRASEDVPILASLLAHKAEDVRIMAAKAMASALAAESKAIVRNKCLSELFVLHVNSLPNADARYIVKDQSSIPRQRRAKADPSSPVPDTGWPAREGVALTLQNMASFGILAEHVPVVFTFFISRGLGDPEEKVRSRVAAAAFSTIESASSRDRALILSMIERQLEQAQPSTREELAHADRTRENLVMCLGSIVGFLETEDPRIVNAAKQVIKTAIGTPSETVQNAAGECLSRLAKPYIHDEETETNIKNELLHRVYDSSSGFGERRGAACSLAGIVTGLGLRAMLRTNLIEEIKLKAGGKSTPRDRQSAMVLFEALSTMLGPFIEPFIPSLLPLLLSCMSDNTPEVRKACWAAAHASMAEISSHGVKLILPTLTSGLASSQWRTKAGSANILGAMAFSAPRQMATSLPHVVPRLATTLSDPHHKVAKAAEDALARIAAVIRNPEVRKLSPFLMAALKSPGDRTAGAIDAMLRTSFTHAIDPASLSLLVPPLHRGLRDRDIQSKLRSAAIIGSMCDNVSSPTDVLPYLPQLLPPLKSALLDSNPGVRKTSAKGLGSLVGALGTDYMPDLLPWLRRAVVSSSGVNAVSSSAERSGAAAGLAEVCACLSDREIETIVKDTLAAGKTSVWAREGGLLLIGSLPEALGVRFEPSLANSLASILAGLADDSDNVREAALQAGKCVVRIYGTTSRESLLPELIEAMQDRTWRIRQSATRLLGDLLLVVGGATGPADEIEIESPSKDEEDQFSSQHEGEENEVEADAGGPDEEIDSPESAAAVVSTEAILAAIRGELGTECLNTTLAALYMIRCDAIFRVRQTGIEVWKRLVANTPRTLRDILPFALKKIVNSLAEDDVEHRETAAKALSDLTMKLGDRVIQEILPSLRDGMQLSKSDRVRRGSIEGLLEIVQSCGRGKILYHADDFTQATVEGLSDPLPEVRAKAATVFGAIMKPLGKDAIEGVLSSLIATVCDVERMGEEECLHSIRQLVTTCGNGILVSLVPLLLKERPLTLGQATGLQAAIEESNGTFEPYVQDVLEVLLTCAQQTLDTDMMETVERILGALNSASDAVAALTLTTLAECINNGLPERRAASSVLLGALCRGSEPKLIGTKAKDIIQISVRQMAESDPAALNAAWKTFGDLATKVSPRILSRDISFIRQSLRSAMADLRVHEPDAVLPGLQLPKAPEPFVPVFVEGLLHGTPELREQAALGMSELIELTSPRVLRPYVIKLTGPLIRVMSDRFPWQVKAAILRTCLRLLEKAPAVLRTFGPQLQNTFVRNLSDGNRLVRLRASGCLGALAPILNRVEQLLGELLGIGGSGTTSEAQKAAFHAFSCVIQKSRKVPDSIFLSGPQSMIASLDDDDAAVGEAAGRALGSLASVAPTTEKYLSILTALLDVLDEPGIEYAMRNNVLVAIGHVFSGGLSVANISLSDIERGKGKALAFMKSENYLTRGAACSCVVDLYMLLAGKELQEAKEERSKLLLSVAELTRDPEVCVDALSSVQRIGSSAETAEMMTPSLVVCSANSNTRVKMAADRALRKMLFRGEGRDLDLRMVQAAKKNLNAGDSGYLDRLIPKLETVPDLNNGDSL